MHATNVLAVDFARDNERLRARVAELEAQLAAMTPARIKLGDLDVDLASGIIRRHDVPVNKLTRIELSIVGALAAAPGTAIPYERIRDVAWPGAYGDGNGEDLRHAIRVNLSRIRGKLDPSPVEFQGSHLRSRHFFVVADVGVGLLL